MGDASAAVAKRILESGMKTIQGGKTNLHTHKKSLYDQIGDFLS